MARKETSTSITGLGGVKETYRLLEYVTVDDIMEMLMQSTAAEIKTGTTEVLPVDRSVKDFLVRTHRGMV